MNEQKTIKIKFDVKFHKVASFILFLLLVIDFSFNCFTINGVNYNQPTMIAQTNCNDTYLLSNLTSKCVPSEFISSNCNLFQIKYIGMQLIPIILILIESSCISLYICILIVSLHLYNTLEEKTKTITRQMISIYFIMSFIMLIISGISYLSFFQYIDNRACFDPIIYSNYRNGCEVDLRKINYEDPYPICEQIIDSCVDNNLIIECKNILADKEKYYNPIVYIPWNYTQTVFDFKEYERRLILGIYPVLMITTLAIFIGFLIINQKE
jgi:hypothetical protein